MSSGQSTQDTSSASVQQIPQWMQQAGQQNYAYAQDVANRPLQQYQGQMVADVAPQTQQFWNTAAQANSVGADQNNLATAGFANSLASVPQSVTPMTLAGIDAATQYPTSSGGLSSSPSGLSGMSNSGLGVYMNPYTQDVINATLPLMQQQNELSQDQAGNAASSANAFGGSRQGVQQGVAQAQGALNIGQMAAQLNQANFAQATAGAQSDIANNLAAQTTNQGAAQAKTNSDILASQGLSNQASSENQENVANASLQSAAGASQSMQAQNEINAQMAKFQQANQYPQQQLSTLLSALGMTPSDTATTGQSNTTTTTPTDWASILTGGLGAASSIAKIASDKRIKKNIMAMGHDPVTAIPIKKFNYKGDPPGTPPVIGPLAQDVEKAMPGSTMKIGGIMAIPKPTLAAATPSIASHPMFSGNAPSPSLARYMPNSSAMGAATTKIGAGARAFGGLANTKRKPKVVGALA